jgi:hypothetical protein
MQIRKIKNKKAVSEMISYILLIVIALSLSIGVYSWLKTYIAPSEKQAEVCPDSVALSLNEYTCETIGSTGKKIVHLLVENKGYFSVNGFFVKASNVTGKGLATVGLSTEDYANPTKGRYEFDAIKKFAPGKKVTANFSFNELGKITKLQLQPYIIGEKTNLIITCDNKIDLELIGCDGSSTPASPTACSSPPVSDGLVSWWRFEDDASDCKGLNPGSPQGSVAYDTGHSGKGLNLTGTANNYIKVLNNGKLTFGENNFTISFWVNTNNAAVQTFLDQFETYGLNQWYIDLDAGQVEFLKNSAGMMQISHNSGNWQHITFARNGSNGIYCNDINCNTENGLFNNINFNSPKDLKIGCDSSATPSNCLNGIIDEVMIFNRTLSATEIALL